MLSSVYVFPFFFFNSEVVSILFISAVNYRSLLRAKSNRKQASSIFMKLIANLLKW